MITVIRSLLGGYRRAKQAGRVEMSGRASHGFHWRVAQLENRFMLAVEAVGTNPLSVATGDFNDDGIVRMIIGINLDEIILDGEYSDNLLTLKPKFLTNYDSISVVVDGEKIESFNDVSIDDSLFTVALTADEPKNADMRIYGYGTNYYVQQKFSEMNNFGLISGFSVFSHWILDFIVHNDDMRIIPTSDQTLPSLYLWEYPLASFIVELVIIITAWEYYLSGLKSSQGINLTRKKPLILVGLLTFLHIVNFLPTFSDADGSEAEPGLGIVVMIMILVIATLMTWLHPEKPETNTP